VSTRAKIRLEWRGRLVKSLLTFCTHTNGAKPTSAMILYGSATRWAQKPARAFPDWARWATYLTVAVLSAGLAGLVAIQLRWAFAFLRRPTEIVYGEALIQDHAARLLRGEALYQPLGLPSFTVVAYTPLFYGLIALGQAVVGPSLLLARVISVLAAMVIVALLARMAARHGQGPAAGLLAALLFIGLGFPTPLPSFALGKEDTLGVALGVASVAVLSRGQSKCRVGGAAILAALAVLTKQTMFAAGLAGFVALGLHNRRAALQFAALSAGPVLAVVLAFELTTHAFFTNAVFANVLPFRTDILLTNLATLKAYQAGPLAVAAFGAVRRLAQRRSFEDTLLPLYWLATLLSVAGLASPGSAQNYWIELAASSAVLATTEIFTWLRGPDMRSRLVGAALAVVPWVNLVVAGRLALIWLPALAPYDEVAVASAQLDSLVERVRSTSGAIVAEPLDALALAGKPTLVEPWESDALYRSGVWDIDPLVDRVCDGDVQLAVLAHALDDTVVAYQEYSIWPAPLQDALRQKMVLVDRVAGRYIYVPRADSNCAPAAED